MAERGSRALHSGARERMVGVKSRLYVHAVLVPHDLDNEPLFEWLTVPREGRTPLIRTHPRWKGRAECGQIVDGIQAGPNGGHDWVLVSERDRCPRCVRAINKQPKASEVACGGHAKATPSDLPQEG